MIAIINVSEKLERTGQHTYTVKINRTTVTTFVHNREDGLVACLEAAAKAVKKYNKECGHSLAHALFLGDRR